MVTIRIKKGDRVYHKDTPNLVGTVLEGCYKEFGIVEVQLDSCRTVVYDKKDIRKVNS